MADTAANKKSKRKKKSKAAGSVPQNGQPHSLPNGPTVTPGQSGAPPPPPPASTPVPKSGHSISRDRIWDTSTQEERERIKEFWLSLGEEERRSLVKVEKEAVLRKMKEQQKHSCSCTVCGRKRTAIEEELEVLYDAYYLELEQYANNQQLGLGGRGPALPSPHRYGPLTGPPPHHPAHHLPSPTMANAHSRYTRPVQDLPDDEDDDDYSDEDDDEEDFSDEEVADADPRGPAADFFNFGNSLTVEGASARIRQPPPPPPPTLFFPVCERTAHG